MVFHIEGYSKRELMALVLARELKDGEVAMMGVASPIPVAACLLAQRMHAPNLTLLMPSGFVNPKPRALYPSTTDGRYLEGAEAVGDFYDLFELSENGRLDVFFYGGVQLDRFGNINLTMIGGDINRPKFRAPGLPNISFAVTARRVLLYLTSHTQRNLVSHVDYISAPGYIHGPDSRSRAKILGGGPELCVTPLAVFDFNSPTKEMRLKSIHEGISPEEVARNTGFTLEVPSEMHVTEPPGSEELGVLRRIDRDGILKDGI